MIHLQEYSALQPTEAIEVDAAVLDLQTKFRTNLDWITHAYGRAYRFAKTEGEKRLIIPEVYVSNVDGKYTLSPVTPDNDKKGTVFFVIDKERMLDFSPNNQNYLRYNVGIVCWVNLELVDAPLVKNEDFTQLLIKEMRDILTNSLYNTGYMLEIVECVREAREVFKEFTLTDNDKYNKMPFTSFRFNVAIALREGCGQPADRESALLQNITHQEICNIILPTLDFSGSDFDCLTDQQKEDLTNRLTI